MLFEFEDRYALFDVTPVDNQFIQEYLPSARGEDVRVYLYGLMRCYHPEADMSLTQMARDLSLPEEEILRAYRYWERKGLVRRVSDNPVSYRYVSVRQRVLSSGEDFQLDPEYEAFADSLYGVFSHGRRLHGSEIRTCYEWVEDLSLPPEAVLMLLRHMESVEGPKFTIASAQKLALQMAQEHVSTVEEAEAFLSRDQAVYQGTRNVLRRLGIHVAPSEDQLALYRKWVQDWGFTPQAVEEACADTAKGTPSMGYLNGILEKLRERGQPGTALDGGDVLRAREENDHLRKVLQALGGGSLSDETVAWYRRVRATYPEEMILLAARECSRRNGRLEDVEKMLDSWCKKGILSVAEAEKYVRGFNAQTEFLTELRNLWGLKSGLGTRGRDLLSKWENQLGFSREVILLCAESAAGTARPMSYLDKVLQTYAEKGIRTRAQVLAERQHAESTSSAPRPGKTVIAQQYAQRNYSGPEESVEDVLRRMEGGLSGHAGGTAEGSAAGAAGTAAKE